MPNHCLLCGTNGSVCGESTVTRVVPVDAPLTGVKVAGDKIVPDLTSVQPTDMNAEEREEFTLMSQAYERRKLRNQIGARGMADGKAPHTQLSYVECVDGITRKMHPDTAREYVRLNEGSSIIREGALPISKEGEVIGATKARVGEIFDDNGRQREELQPITSRTFHATDRVSDLAVRPAVGTVGAASTEVMTGTGSMTSSAVSGKNDDGAVTTAPVVLSGAATPTATTEAPAGTKPTMTPRGNKPATTDAD